MFPTGIPNFIFRSSATLELLTVYSYSSPLSVTEVKKGYTGTRKILFNHLEASELQTISHHSKPFSRYRVVQKFKFRQTFLYRGHVY